MFRTKQSRTEAAVRPGTLRGGRSRLSRQSTGSARVRARRSAGATLLAPPKDRAYAGADEPPDARRSRTRLMRRAGALLPRGGNGGKDVVVTPELHEAADRASRGGGSAVDTRRDRARPRLAPSSSSAAAALAAGAEQAREAAERQRQQQPRRPRQMLLLWRMCSTTLTRGAQGRCGREERVGRGSGLFFLSDRPTVRAGAAAVFAPRARLTNRGHAARHCARQAGRPRVRSRAMFKDKAAEMVGHAKEAVADAGTEGQEEGLRSSPTRPRTRPATPPSRTRP